jgi:hypothetical protein
MASSESPTQHRRIVTGHRGGKAVVLSDTPLATYAFKTMRGFEHAYVWKTETVSEADPEQVDLAVPKSALPPASGSLVHVVTSHLRRRVCRSPPMRRQSPGSTRRAFQALPTPSNTMVPGCM